MKSTKEQRIFYILICLFLVSLIYSKFLLSVSMIGLVFFGLFQLDETSWNLHIRRDLASRWRAYLNAPAFYLLALMPLVYLISGINSSDLGEWIWRVRTKAPFIFFPLAIILAPKLKAKDYQSIFYTFVGVATLSLVLVLLPMLWKADELIQLIYVGKAIPTPCHHVRYSLIIAFAAILSIDFAAKSEGVRRFWMGLIFLFLVGGLHFLAVRSGLVAFYLALFSWVFFAFQGYKRYIYAAVALGAIVLLPIVAFKYSPSFKQKMDYMMWDWKQYQEGKGITYSDSERIISLQAGWELLKENPFLGVGIGDLKPEIKENLAAKDITVKRLKFPHNQFLFVLTACGIPLAILFFFGLLSPLYFYPPWNSPIIFSFYALVITSFMVENTIENAVGTAFVIGFLSLLMKKERDIAHFQ